MTLTADFELGTNGSDVLTSDPGSVTAWDVRNVTGGSLKYDNTFAIGAMSAKVVYNGTSAATGLQWTTAWGTQTEHYNRQFIYMQNYPSNSSHNGMWGYTTGGSGVGWQVQSTGLMSIAYQAFQGFTGHQILPLNTWIRLEWHVIHGTGTSGTYEMKMFFDAHSDIPSEVILKTGIDTGASSTAVTVGCPQTTDTVFTYWMDGIVAGAPSYVGSGLSPTVAYPTSIPTGRGRW